ncbi:MAG: hypothetical protein P1U56_19395 [Saprospiraceae bacterium]|nr:hypothetical protein [Saprospiraceae bacterium]
MAHLKLIEGLKILDKEEWVSFRKYSLMYCSKQSDNYKLLQYLSENRSRLDSFTEVEHIRTPKFARMTAKNFSNLMSRVFSWFEEWFIWKSNLEDQIGFDVQLVKLYNRRGAFRLANKTYKRVERKLLATDQLDLSTHKNLYLLHHNHYVSDNPVKYERKAEILESLISYFLIQFKEQAFLYFAELYNWGKIQNHDFVHEKKILNALGALIEDSETLEVIYQINSMVINLDRESFMTLKESIYSGRINPDSELYILASLYMIEFSMRLWNNNKLEDAHLVLEAYDFGLESGILLKTGKMSITRFINLVVALGYLNLTSRVYDFIDKWYHLIEGEEGASTSALAYAHLKFIEKKYAEIIPFLVGMKFVTEFGKMRASSLELISLYSEKQRNYHLLNNRIHNFKRVLNNLKGKQSKDIYKIYINFIRVLELLIKREFIKITIHIEDYSPIIYKKWLIEEIKAGQ